MVDISAYSWLVHSLAKTFNLARHYDDLVSEGMIGLWKAAKKFNPRHKTKFTTYAHSRIRWAMQDYLRNYAGAGRKRPGQRNPHLLDIKTYSLHNLNKRDKYFVGNIEQPGNGKDLNLLTKTAEIIRSAHSVCTPREVRYIRMRYEGKGMTIKAIGEKAGLSDSRISQICTSAITKLRRSFGVT